MYMAQWPVTKMPKLSNRDKPVFSTCDATKPWVFKCKKKSWAHFKQFIITQNGSQSKCEN